MAYAAAISLTHTIERLSNSCRISIVSNSSVEIINFLYDEVYSVLGVVEEKPDIICNINRRRKINVFDEQIRETLHELEDVLETHVLQQLIPQSDTQEEVEEIQYPSPLFSLDHQELKQNIDSFTQKLNKMKAAYIQIQGDDGFDDVIVQSKFDFGGQSDQMIGLSDQFTEIKNQLIENFSQGMTSPSVSLLGMAGIGKTTLAKKLFHDASISSLYRKRAFVKLGPKYQLERILRDILKQLNHDVDVGEEKVVLAEEGEEVLDGLKRMIRGSIMNRPYFIVLDDLWDKDEFYVLTSSFPFLRNGSQVLVTTRLQNVAQKANRDCINTIRFLDKKESWELLRHKVFDEMPCPPELEKAGKKIAENCEGLPLTIVSVADILSKGEKTTEYWNEVAADKKSAVFVDVYDQMFEVLYPSYAYLYQHLKPCFLYMGVFRQNHEISRSRLVNLLIVEGFLEPVYEDANMFFEELVSNSLVVVQKQSFVTKTFSLPSPFWYLCNKESKKNKFFHALNSYADGLAQECVKSQRRLAIRNNILFGIKDVHDSIASASTVRSLLCTGPYHQYPVPICLEYLRLLRILDALTIPFYEFPTEVVNIVQLTYLALTFNGNIPAFISKLWNLQYLIVHRSINIVESNGNSSYLPTEIWDMEELNYLHIMGKDLPNPYEGSLLPNLLTLLDVSPRSCTKDVLERIPNLQKLGIRIELPYDSDEPLFRFDHFPHLSKLETLKCVVVNPRIVPEVVAPHAPRFPSRLVKLTLNGLGYPWEELNKIASSLPNLQILKLRCYAFRGPKWEVCNREFRQLRYLLIEDTDLVHWTFGDGLCLYFVEFLGIHDCYKLEEIPLTYSKNHHLKKIELVDCNPTAVNCANKLKEDWDHEYGGKGPLVVNVHSSWDV